MLLVTPVIGTRGRHLDDPTPDAVTRRSDLHGWHPRRERRWITNSAGVKPAGTCTCCRNDHTNAGAYVHHPRGRSSLRGGILLELEHDGSAVHGGRGDQVGRDAE